MQAKVDPQICIGCALCTQTCPPVFRMDGDKAVAYEPEVPESAKTSCKNAAEQCPVNAIIVEE